MERPGIELDVILEGIEDGIIAQDSDGEIRYANSKAASLLHFPSAERLMTQSTPALAEQFEASDEAGRTVPFDMLPGRQALCGLRMPPQTLCFRSQTTGEELWLSVNALPVRDDEGKVKVAVTIFRDMTDQKASEDARRQSDELFARAFRVSPAALWISNIETGAALDVNDSFLRITGYDREEIVGQTTMSLGLWADSMTRSEVVAALREHGSVHDLEFRFRKKSGELREGLLSAEIADIQGETCMLVSCADITVRKRAEAELTRLLTEVQAGREALQALSRRLLEVQEGERRYIARELHDQIGQVLTAVQINLESIERLPEAKELSARLEESISLVDHALQQIRGLSLDLRPSLLDDLGLVSALLWYVERQSRRTGVDIQLAVEPLPERLPPDTETASFRIVQEALTNVARHSGATEVRVELCVRDGTLQLGIKDNGAGFDVSAARERASSGSSMGLLGMQERAELVGGKITIESSEGQGTNVRAALPL